MVLQIPDVLNAEELGRLRGELAQAVFESGATTAGYAARAVKHNLQLAPDSEAGRRCAALVMQALQRSPLFFSAVLPHRMHGPLFNLYQPGMTYGEHIDNAIMGAPTAVRTDVSATLFLSAPEDYEGGELVVHGAAPQGLKFPAGSVAVYASSRLHQVQPVRRGRRFAAVLWVQSLVRDEMRRSLLFELDVSLGALRQRLPDAPEVGRLTAVYHNLLRQWADT